MRVWRYRVSQLWRAYAAPGRIAQAAAKGWGVLGRSGPGALGREVLRKIRAPHEKLGGSGMPATAEEDVGGYRRWISRWERPSPTLRLGGLVDVVIVRQGEPVDWWLRTVRSVEGLGLSWSVAGDTGEAKGPSGRWWVAVRAGDVLNAAGLCRALSSAPDGAELLFGDHDFLNAHGERCRPYFKGAGNRRLTSEDPGWLGPCLIRRGAIGFKGSGDELLGLGVELYLNRRRAEHVPMIMSHLAPPVSEGMWPQRLGRFVGEGGRLRGTEKVPDANAERVAGKVSVIVPYKGRRQLLEQCMEAVRHGGYANADVVLVNNGRESGWAHDCMRGLRGVVAECPGRFNFSALCNAGIRQSDGEFVLLLNNDTSWCGGEWLKEMVREMDDPSVGAVGNLLLYPDGTVQHAGIALGFGVGAGHLYRYYRRDARGYHDTLRVARDCFAVTGACMLVRRASLNDVGGGLDESLPVDFNDVLLCAQLWRCGWRVVWTPRSQLIHAESQSRSRQVRVEDLWRFKRLCPFEKDPLYSEHLDLAEPGFAFKK